MNGTPANDTTARVVILVTGLREIIDVAEKTSEAIRRVAAIAWGVYHFEPYQPKPGEAVARFVSLFGSFMPEEPPGSRLPRPRFPVGFV